MRPLWRVRLTGNGEPVTDPDLAAHAMSWLLPDSDPVLEAVGDGWWLADLPVGYGWSMTTRVGGGRTYTRMVKDGTGTVWLVEAGAYQPPEEAVPNRPPCLCGCGGFPKRKRSRFLQGHDARLQKRATGRPESPGRAPTPHPAPRGSREPAPMASGTAR